MRTVVVIPARYGSNRFPGKPLAAIRQPGGGTRTLIQMTWHAACAIDGVSAVIVATDDARIAASAREAGAEVVMTAPERANGTERCAEALEASGLAADLVVNFQGDAPLTPPWFVEALIDTLRADGTARVATPVMRCDRAGLSRMIEDRRAGMTGATTAVFDRRGDALYFSKEILPHLPPGALAQDTPPAIHHHVGVYAFRPEALAAYAGWPPGRLETLEGLEQLRFLENGVPVRCVPVEARGRPFWEVNNPGDVARIEAALEEG
ncbi:3-deoxy-manno-octulosonate cytidylyltransferase [Rhodobacteraceae bacterium WD3A24]|nr:3-deoxy-manno-octulosonate cytidylyltransferase [Rhodobacteraceae bacterium WD3A24]